MTIDFITLLKAIINTLIRLMPVGLYAGSTMSALVFNDFRGSLLFIGFILNEFISLGYRMILRGITNPQCALTRINDEKFFVLPSPIGQTIGFFSAFILMEMYSLGEFKPIRFFIIMTLLLTTIWSRNNVGCMSLLDSIFSVTVGILLGICYFTLVKPYYRRDYLKLKEDPSSDELDDDFFKLG